MLILNLKLKGLVPPEYPDTCECGFAFEAYGNDGKFTSIDCTNTMCPIKSQFTITEMLEKLNIKANIGDEKAAQIVKYMLSKPEYDYKCCMDLLAIPRDEVYMFPNNLVTPIAVLLRKVDDINNSGGITLPVYMSLWCFDGLGETYCQRIFATYSSIQEFYEEFEKKTSDATNKTYDKRALIAKYINQSEGTATVYKIYNILTEYKEEILRCSKYFKFKSVPKKLLQLCITGEVINVRREDGTVFKPRDTFGEYLRDKYNINIVLNKSYNSKVDFVVCDTPSNSRKAVAARKATRKDEFSQASDDPAIKNGNRLITSDELVKLLESNQ